MRMSAPADEKDASPAEFNWRVKTSRAPEAQRSFAGPTSVSRVPTSHPPWPLALEDPASRN